MIILCPLCENQFNLNLFKEGSNFTCSCGNIIKVEKEKIKNGNFAYKNLKLNSISLKKEDLHSLIKLCNLMVSTLSKDELINSIIKASTKILKVESSAIILLSENKEELIFCFVSGKKSKKLKEIKLKYGEGVVGDVIDKDMYAIVNDTENDKRFCKRVDSKTGKITYNILCVPMKIKNKVIGALEVVNKLSKSDFNQYDLNICQAIANLSSVALERALLYDENIKNARLAGIGQAISGIAHCVKNILNGLKGGEYMVNRGMEKDDKKIITDGWNMVEKNIKKISTLVLDMLYYSKEREPEYEKVDINMILNEVKELFEIEANKLNISIEIISDKKIKIVEVDPKGIFRCLVNLVGNAIDACAEKGGKVTMESKFYNKKYFKLTVKDTGQGMDKKTLANLFSKFFSTKGSKGTGLGLPVTAKIIKEHKGEIEVNSSLGIGTIFSIMLPINQL